MLPYNVCTTESVIYYHIGIVIDRLQIEKKSLIPGAVPTLFEVPNPPQIVTPSRSKPNRRYDWPGPNRRPKLKALPSKYMKVSFSSHFKNSCVHECVS